MAPFRCRLPPACMPPAPACMPDHCARRQVAGDVGEARTKGFGGLCRFPAAQVCGLHGGWYPQAACAGCLRACSATRACASTMHALPTACHVPSISPFLSHPSVHLFSQCSSHCSRPTCNAFRWAICRLPAQRNDMIVASNQSLDHMLYACILQQSGDTTVVLKH